MGFLANYAERRQQMLDHKQVVMEAPPRERRMISARYYALLVIGAAVLAMLV